MTVKSIYIKYNPKTYWYCICFILVMHFLWKHQILWFTWSNAARITL